MDDDKSTPTFITPEQKAFLIEPMSRIEVVQLVQPRRSSILSIFHGAMTSLTMLALTSENPDIKDKARKSFEELRDVFAEIDQFDERLGKLLAGDPEWALDKDGTTHE